MTLLMRLVESRRPDAVSEITDDAVPRPSFYVLVLLSTAIASYGLLANRTAVVIVAGLAGGYARVSERVRPTLPGVTIATALVPPLAACGLCLSDA